MNEWLKLTKMLTEAIPDLPTPAPLRATMSLAAIAERELAKREDIDAAIHSFSTSGRWPLLDHEESYLIEERIRFGLCIARALETPDASVGVEEGASLFPGPHPDFSVDQQLQWLLIAAWNHVGRETWGSR